MIACTAASEPRMALSAVELPTIACRVAGMSRYVPDALATVAAASPEAYRVAVRTLEALITGDLLPER